MDDAALARLGHLNLIEFSRELARWSGPRGQVVERDGVVCFATGSDFPAVVNGAFALDPAVGPTALLDVAEAYFGDLGRGFTVWADDRDGTGDALAAEAEARGLLSIGGSPEMVARSPLPERPAPEGMVLRWVTDVDGVTDFLDVDDAAYQSLGMPAGVTKDVVVEPRAMLEPHIHSVVAYLDGEPVGAAQTLLSHGIAGVYWVGSTEAARGRGVGEAVTRAVTNRGFEAGASATTLQASHMGEAIYERMGYETLYRYRTFTRFVGG